MAGGVEFKHEHWGSTFGFLMASIGSAVGLGNFWRFPTYAGENGGGAFVLVYIICVALVAFPVLVAEYGLGRRGGYSSIESVARLAEEAGKSQSWAGLSWIGGLGAFFILVFYCVIAGWVMAYVPLSFSGEFNQMDSAGISARFGVLVADVNTVLIWQAAFIVITCFIVARGVRGGLEAANSILMPLFFVMLAGLLVFGLVTGNPAKTFAFLFQPDFSEVTINTWLAALSQALFSVGVGSSLMITYGAYLDKKTNIPRSAALVALSDTLVALVAGTAIFLIVFSHDIDPAGGPGLIFQTLPIAFSQIPGGQYLGAAFFVLAFFAALTSSISLMEVGIAWLEERHGVTRLGATIGVGFVLWVFGAGTVYSSQYLDFVDFISGSVLLPVAAFLICIFAGYVAVKKNVNDEIDPSGKFIRWWRPLIMVVAPIAVAAIFIGGIIAKFF